MKKTIRLILALVLAAAACLPAITTAGDSESLDAVLEGFEETAPLDTQEIFQGFDEEAPGAVFEEEHQDDATESIFQVNGHLKLATSFTFAHQAPDAGQPDWRGLSRLRPEFQAEVKAELGSVWQGYVSANASRDVVYALKDREGYTGQVLSRNESEIELREAWIQGRLNDHLDIKAGRQIAVWGKSDNIRVTDVLNPLDMREPGLTDIEDLRLPVTMTRLDAYFGPWNLTGIAVHEIRFNKLPAWGSDFFPAAAPLPPESVPVESAENTEFGLALSGVFSGWDAALYHARICDDTAHLHRLGSGVERRHARLAMWGGAANMAFGNWLLKAEAAWFQGLEFYSTPGEDFERIDILGGVEYSGFTDTTVTLEAVGRRILDFDQRLKSAPDQASEEDFQSALRITRDFLNDTLTVTLLAMTYGPTGQDGAFQRLSVAYDLTDAVKITSGGVLYQSGDLPEMRRIGDNDRMYCEVKYSF